MGNSKNSYLKQVLHHLMDITGGNCAITDEMILSEKNEEVRDILAGLKMLHEDHQYSLAEITKINEEGKERTESLLGSITSLAMLDYDVKAHVSEKGNEFDALATGINILGEELKVSTYSSSYLDGIIQAIPGTFIVTDEKGIIKKMNQATERILGYKAGALLGKHISKVLTLSHQNGLFLKTSDLIEFQNCDENLKTESGEFVEVSLSASVIGNIQNEIEGFVFTGQDISEVRYMSRELQKQNDRISDIIDNVNQIIYTAIFDDEGKPVLDYVSKSVEPILGYTTDEFLKMSMSSDAKRYHPDDVVHVNRQLRKLRKKGESVVITYRSLHNKQQKYIWLEDRIVPKFDTDGNLRGVFGSTSDVTVRKEAEIHSERFRLVMDAAGDSFYLVDPNKKDLIIDVSSSACRELGYTREELLSMSVSDFEIGLSYKERTARNKMIFDNSKVNKSTLYLGVHRRKDETTFPVEISVIVRKIAGKSYQLAAVRDITERVVAQQELAEREARYRAITESAQDAIISIDSDGRIIMWNESAGRMFGYREEDMIGQKLTRIIPGKNGKSYEGGIHGNSKTGGSTLIGKSVELEGLKKNGSVIPLELTLSEWMLGDEKFVTGIIKDITERKRATRELWQSEQRYRRFIDQSLEMIYSYNVETGLLIEANPTFLRTLGYTAAEAWKMKVYDLVVDSKKVINANTRRLKKEGSLSLGERDWRCKNGELVSVLVSIILVKDGSRELGYVIAHDVTQNRKDRMLIEQSLEEKELLLKEVHHRVKNNLQVISSLLDLQANSENDDNLIEKLRESQNRVRSMALVHEKLYGTEELNGIDLGQYALELAKFLHSTYQKKAGVVQLKLDVKSVKVSITQAIPCGLIINEAVSNSMKYAFPNSNSGIIKVQIGVRANKIELLISDDGVGFDAEVELDKPATLGLKLIGVLAKQLGATLETKSTLGVRHKIVFQSNNK